MLKVAIVSSEEQRARQLQAIFPEWKMHVEHLGSPHELLKHVEREWDGIVIDLDVVVAHSLNVVEFVKEATNRTGHILLLISNGLMHLEPQFAEVGTYVLRKPTSSGEIAIALRMLFKSG